MTTLHQTNALESILEAVGYPPEHAVQWAALLLRQVEASGVDNALVGFLVRRDVPDLMRQALAEMPPHILALCLARMVAFGMTEDEIKRLLPVEVNR